jgi:hypothetical protein
MRMVRNADVVLDGVEVAEDHRLARIINPLVVGRAITGRSAFAG